jgi:WD40 repeat protein
MMIHRILLTAAGICALAAAPSVATAELPIEIAEIKRDQPVDFAGEIYPLLKRNCLACHHAKETEGGLNLESHEAMLKGGDSGAAVVAKDVANSLILTRASGSEEPLMPPEDNTVGAKPLTPQQLGLLKLWIEQGAPGGEVEVQAPIAWQPIPESVRTIYALATSPDGRLAAVGRGNRVAVYDLATAAEVGRLVDPSIESMSGPGAADVDMIQSIAFSPDGKLIATGGFRSVRLWRQTAPASGDLSTPVAAAAGLVATNQDATQIALVNAIGDIETWDTASNKRLQTISGHADLITGLAWSPAADRLFSCDTSGKLILWQASTGTKLAEHEAAAALHALAASQDGSAIAAVDAQRQVRFWRVVQTPVENKPDAKTTVLQSADLEVVKPITDATAVAFAGKPAPTLIVASETAGVLLVGLGDGKQIRKIDHGAPVDALAVSPDATQLATGGRDGKTKLWKTENGEAIRTLEGDPESRIRIAAANRDVARQKAAVARLEARTAQLEKALTTENEAAAKVKEERDKANQTVAEEEKKRAAAVAKVTATEGTITKTTTNMKTAETKAAEAQKKISEQEAMKKAIAAQVAQAKEARDKAAAALAAEEQKYKDVLAKMTAVDTELTKSKTEVETSTKMAADAKAELEKLAKQLEAEKKAATAAEEAKKKSDAELAKREQALAAATQAQQRAAAAVPEHKLVVASEQRRSELLAQRLVSITNRTTAPENAVVAVTFGGDNRVATAHAGGSLRSYDANGLPFAAFTDRAITQRPSNGVAFLPDDRICSYAAGRPAVTWSLATTWELERTIGSPNESPISDRVTALDFRRDGLSLAVGSGPPSRFGDVKVFAVGSGQLVRDFGEVHSDTVLGLRFSPDGRTLASSSADKTIRLLDLTDGSLIRSLEGHTHHVLSLAWQDDAQTIASASADQNVKVWNVETGQQRRTIGGFPKEITAIAFVQQTPQVITACADGQLRLYDTTNGKSIRSFNAAGDFLFALSVTDDGKTLLAGGQSGILRVFNLADGKQLHEVK